MKKKERTLLAVVAIVIVSVLGLWGIDLDQGYLMVSDLTENPQEYIGQNVNTMGTIKNDTLNMSLDKISFVLVDADDANHDIYVEYTGDLPANLMEGKSISLSGRMVSEDQVMADQIVMGCPSKYKE
ncbi:MAG: cytochrome c maturation protein CcmE [Methanosarcinaceae archaeon]|nr:cytochrome c maturation protein CcmE [Methanosarcinaceae archaeon]